MHPRFRSPHLGKRRFLRPRGDAPSSTSTSAPTTSVPPPTRRCTRNQLIRRLIGGGSSAHAEMHPALRVSGSVSEWFLRPRGDAPALGELTAIFSSVPPPTRRCTRVPARRGRRGGGSSAHAEMHPRERRSRVLLHRFLRPRGDAPSLRARSLTAERVPPPTRRCTARDRCHSRRSSGSSAHAEMHLCSRAFSSRSVWFLRPRGDAPTRFLASNLKIWVPPPTRRCTFHRPSDLGRLRGSSAHAEMHRGPTDRCTFAEGFLRPRGDAPGTNSIAADAWSVPPPTRRCTRTRRDDPRLRNGSSAHAEMHPPVSRRRLLPDGFLRPRGDAPVTPPPLAVIV